jgi:hypothetical protein
MYLLLSTEFVTASSSNPRNRREIPFTNAELCKEPDIKWEVIFRIFISRVTERIANSDNIAVHSNDLLQRFMSALKSDGTFNDSTRSCLTDTKETVAPLLKVKITGSNVHEYKCYLIDDEQFDDEPTWKADAVFEGIINTEVWADVNENNNNNQYDYEAFCASPDYIYPALKLREAIQQNAESLNSEEKLRQAEQPGRPVWSLRLAGGLRLRRPVIELQPLDFKDITPGTYLNTFVSQANDSGSYYFQVENGFCRFADGCAALGNEFEFKAQKIAVPQNSTALILIRYIGECDCYVHGYHYEFLPFSQPVKSSIASINADAKNDEELRELRINEFCTYVVNHRIIRAFVDSVKQGIQSHYKMRVLLHYLENCSKTEESVWKTMPIELIEEDIVRKVRELKTSNFYLQCKGGYTPYALINFTLCEIIEQKIPFFTSLHYNITT